MKPTLLLLCVLVALPAAPFLLGCAASEHEDHADHKIAYYTCPMHPEVRSDRKSTCPICGMDLTPVYADDADDDDSEMADPTVRLRISPVQQQLIGMQFDTVQVRTLHAAVRTVARVAPVDRRISEVTLRVMGYIEKTHVNEIGVLVRRDQPLVTVYSPELVSSQQELLIAMEANDAPLLHRSRERLRLFGVPESEIERLVAEGAPLLEVTLTAPFDGIVQTKNVREGMQVMPGMMLYTIVDISHVWLIADVYEDDLPYVKMGQPVTFELQGKQGESFSGRVSFIPPLIDPMTRTVAVRIEIPNPQYRIKLDQYGWVSFRDDIGEHLAVHRDAVLLTGKRAVVFREVGRGRFEPVDVHLGPLAGTYYRVLHGLQNGNRVVTSGRFFLDADSRLRGIGAAAVH